MIIPWLHIYGQSMWHCEAEVCGDRAGIEALRDTLTAALESPDGVSMAEVFVNDGEGYHVHVHVLDAVTMERLAPPYTDEVARGRAEDLWPHQLPVQPKMEQRHD